MRAPPKRIQEAIWIDGLRKIFGINSWFNQDRKGKYIELCSSVENLPKVLEQLINEFIGRTCWVITRYVEDENICKFEMAMKKNIFSWMCRYLQYEEDVICIGNYY